MPDSEIFADDQMILAQNMRRKKHRTLGITNLLRPAIADPSREQEETEKIRTRRARRWPGFPNPPERGRCRSLGRVERRRAAGPGSAHASAPASSHD